MYKTPQWVTTWPDWLGQEFSNQNVTVVPKSNYDTIERELAACRAEIARCHARLEIDHYFVSDGKNEMARVEVPYADRLTQTDGISCRDETIKMLQDQVDRSRLAAHAEREGADELARHLDGEHHAIVAQQIDSPMNACSLKPTCLWLKKLAASHPAPSPQTGGGS